MTNIPRMSPERPIIWSPGCPTAGSRRCPMDVPIYNFWIFVFPIKNSNKCAKQRLLHLKNTFFIKSSIFCGPLRVPWRSPEGPLEVLDVSTFRGLLGPLETSPEYCMLAGYLPACLSAWLAGWLAASLPTYLPTKKLYSNAPT